MPNIDWSKAKSQYETIISNNGEWLQWLQRVTSGSSAFDSGSNITFGYGDFVHYFITGSVKALVIPLRSEDVVLEAGFFLSDYQRIYIDPDETISMWEQLIIPSGSGILYLIKSVDHYDLGGSKVVKFADVRRLFPRSGSTY